MAMLQATILQRVRDILGDNPWQASATAAAATGTITPGVVGRWDEGATMEFQDQGEQAWIQVQNTATLTALRGINGTTAAIHAAGTVVYRDPTYTYKRTIDSIEMIAQSLWPDIYKVSTATLTYDSTSTFYGLPADVMGIIEVNQQKIGGAGRVAVYGAGSSPVLFNLPTAVATNTIGMAFPNGWGNITNPINVIYAGKYTATQTTAGTYADFIDGDWADMIAHGAAARLLRMTEAARVNNEDIGMGDSSVTPGARRSAGEQMWQIYLDKKRQYQQQLLRNAPLRGNEEGNPYLGAASLMPGYTTSPPWS